MKKVLTILLAAALCVLFAACGSTAPEPSIATPDISAEVVSESTPSLGEPDVSESETSEPATSEEPATSAPASTEPEDTEDVADYPDPPAGGDGVTTLKVLQNFWKDFFTGLPVEKKIAATYEDVAKIIGTEGLLSFPAYAEPGHAYYKWVAPSEESIFLDFKVRDDSVYYFFNGGATGLKIS